MKNTHSVFAPTRVLTRVLALAWLLAGAVLTSCVSDETILDGPEPTGNGNELLLRLKTPGSFATPATRVTFAQENAVNDVWVLAVDGANVVAMAKGYDTDFDTNDDYDGSAADPDDNSATGTFSVVLPNSLNGKTIKLVVLANAEYILEGTGYIQIVDGKFVPVAGVAVGNSYTDVRAELIGNLGEDQDGEIVNSIPMWGEVTVPTLSPSASPTVTLMRAVARLDVGVGKPTYTKGGDYPWVWDNTGIPFVLTGVKVYSRTSQYFPIPDLDVNGKSVLTPKSSASMQISSGTITNEKYTTQNIYLPESAAKVNNPTPTMDDADHNSRTYIIVEGIYTGDNSANTTPTFYRLDFADEDENLLDILRNHLYRFNITSVDGPGYLNEAEARTSRPMNMTVDLVEIDEGASGYAVFDDEYYLSVDPGEFMLQAVAGSSTFTLQTDYPKWTATVSDKEDGTNNSPLRPWLTFPTSTPPDATTISGDDNGEAPQTIKFNFDWNAAGAVRTAWITFKAGRMTLKVKVTQEVGVFAAPGMIGYIAGTDILTIRGSKEYAGSPVMGFNGDQNLARATGQPLEKETVYAAYFKPGSLVAVSSEYTNTAFSVANVVNRPAEWGGVITDYASIPYVLLSNDQANDGNELMTQTEKPANPTEGIGDPCMYWDKTNNWDGDWKLPTGNSWYKEGGSPFGTDNPPLINVDGINRRAWPAVGGNGSGAKWVAAVGDPKSFGISGAVGGDGKGGQDWSMFLPDVGYRDATGKISYQGFGGLYTTSTYMWGEGVNGVYGIGSAYMSTSRNEVCPVNMTAGTTGLSVRCVPTSLAQVSFLKVPKAPTPFHDAVTPQSIAVESNTAWTVTENIDWLEIVQGTASGTGNGSFSLKGTPDLDEELPASYYAPGKVTVTSGTNTVELDVNFLWGGYDDIIYFGADGRLKIGKWAPAEAKAVRALPADADEITSVDQLAFFKFGSVIGFTSANADWKLDYIKFNPSQYTVGASGDIKDYSNGAAGAAQTYPAVNKPPYIPGYNVTIGSNVGEDDAVVSVSDAVYNDLAHIRMGKGDPCQWIGLTADEIKGATSPAALQRLLDNREAKYKGWRLPTWRENVNFAGEGDMIYANWITVPLSDLIDDDVQVWIPNSSENSGIYVYDYWREATGYAAPFSMLPTVDGYRTKSTQILPVVDSRNSAKAQDNNHIAGGQYQTSGIGVDGMFWSSTSRGGGNIVGVEIYKADITSTGWVAISAGAMVRCVR